jgi:hypothetical protein
VSTDPGITAFQIVNEGDGAAGAFLIDNDSNDRNALDVQTNGLGPAGTFRIYNSNNTNAALEASTIGSGPALWAKNFGAGTALSAINADDGTGRAGVFQNLNPDNHEPVLHVRTASSVGDALVVRKNSAGRALFVDGQGAITTSTATVLTGGLLVNQGAMLRATDSTQGFAVWAIATGGAEAAQFDGKVTVQGELVKSSGGFVIDHPLHPESMYLYHSFVESPDMMNIYNGKVVLDANGQASVMLPSYFKALNQDFRYQLTPIGAPAPNLHVAERISGDFFKVAGGKPGLEVSWQVTGIRKDTYAEAHRIAPEVRKERINQGRYLHPREFGKSAELKIRHVKEEVMKVGLGQTESHGG